MDVLSEVLKSVKMDGAVFYNAEFSSPWSFRSPPSCALAPYLTPPARHVIIYHLLIEGRGYARLEDGERMALESGDVVIFPHGDAHIIENGRSIKPMDTSKILKQIFSEGLKLSRMGGGGEVTRLVCGYMVCELELAQVFLGGLPPIFKVNIRNDAAESWLEKSIRFSVSEVDDARAGGEAVLTKLSETLFVETLRRYIARLPAEQTGWLAGARDPETGRVLAMMHRYPARPWTIADFAKDAGISRSVLADRFQHFLGEPPISYLTRWRLQLGAQMLKSTNYSVAQIALEVGYESEQAFNRAFKRKYNLPPARFRAANRGN
jgi:AraC-like DNA-binding protein